jgi:hypothetical protein
MSVHSINIEAGAVIEASTGTHFLVVTGDRGIFRLVNIDAGWWVLDPIFNSGEEVIAFFDNIDADLPEDNKCVIERIVPAWAVKVREERAFN